MAKLIRTTTILLFLVGISRISLGQPIYLNSYIPDQENMANSIMEIDLSTGQIADSLILPSKGSFTSEAPLTLAAGAHVFLITALVNGLAAKNSQIRDKTYSYYFLVNGNNLNIIREDSLINKMIGPIKRIYSDSISFDWIDEEGGAWNRSIYTLGPPFNRLHHVRDRTFTDHDFQNDYINGYASPNFICQIETMRYYWGYHEVGDSSYVNILGITPDTTIIAELQIGNRRIQNIITGYSPESGKIYSFLTPYKLLSSYPLSQSPIFVNPEIIIIDPDDLTVQTRLPLQMGEAYAAQETGTAKASGPFLYYYYFMQDGYGQFDPAYLLIFDTRTNEASWLRVGWR